MTTTTADELRAALSKAERKAAKLRKKLDAQKAEPTTVAKGELPAEVREMIAKAERETEKLRKQAADAEKLAKEERDRRVEREFVEKAEREFPYLGSAQELGPRLMRMADTLSKEDYDAHLTELRAANERLEKSALFEEIGKSGQPAGGAENPAQEIEKRAEEIRKADSSLTPYQAFEQAMRENREAQARYLAAVR